MPTIKYHALPYPLPAHVAGRLQNAGIAAIRTQQELDRLPAGHPDHGNLKAELAGWRDEIAQIEKDARRVLGVEVTREAMLPIGVVL